VVRNTEAGLTGAVRPLWSEAENLRERISQAHGLFAFFSFDAALAQRAAHGHLRTNPAARAALIRLCAAPNTRGAVLSGRPIEVLQRRLRLHRLSYVGIHGAQIAGFGLRLVTEPDLESAEAAIGRLRKACSRIPLFQPPGAAIEDRTYSLTLHLRSAEPQVQVQAAEEFTRLAAGENLNVRRGPGCLEACPQGTGLGLATLGLLVGFRGALPVYVGAGEGDEEGFEAINGVGGLSVHVGAPQKATSARFQVADCGEVIRLIHWLADARRRLH